MKSFAALILLISVAEGFFGRYRNFGHNHQHPGPFQPPPQQQDCVCPTEPTYQPPVQTFSPLEPSYLTPGLDLGKITISNVNPFQNFNIIDNNEVEWVCRNQKTGDTMIVTNANGQPFPTTPPNTREVPNTNGNNNQGNPPNGNPNNSKPNEYENKKSTPQPNVEESTCQYGKENCIDVRISQLNK